jgi:hypothetical protein
MHTPPCPRVSLPPTIARDTKTLPSWCGAPIEHWRTRPMSLAHSITEDCTCESSTRATRLLVNVYYSSQDITNSKHHHVKTVSGFLSTCGQRPDKRTAIFYVALAALATTLALPCTHGYVPSTDRLRSTLSSTSQGYCVRLHTLFLFHSSVSLNVHL